MNSLVLEEGGVTTKGFSAVAAYKAFLSTMHSLMDNKRRILTESFLTMITFVGFFSSMVSQMYNKGMYTKKNGKSYETVLMKCLKPINRTM